MHLDPSLPTINSWYSKIEEYPYAAWVPEDPANVEAIKHFISLMSEDSKVYLGVTEEDKQKSGGVSRLANHEVQRRLGHSYDRSAAYYDASGLPVRIFYRGVPSEKDDSSHHIRTPLKIFGRREPYRDVQIKYREARLSGWRKWETIQRDPAYHGLQLPTALAALSSNGCETQTSVLSFNLTKIAQIIKPSGPRRRLTFDPNSRLYSTTYTPGKVKVNADNRGDGSPSSPFVTIVRRLDFEDGVPCGRAVVYFLRIEKVNGRYVPWRGPPPLPPPPPASPRLCLVNAALR